MGLPILAAEGIALTISAIFIAIGLYKFRFSAGDQGAHNDVSLTNVQIILWTGVILGTYAGIASLKGDFLGDIPANLVALMGVSAGSTVTAISIRAVQNKDMPQFKEKRKTKGLLSYESAPQELSLPKLQVFLWTIVAILIYVIVVANNMKSGISSLPDPGSGLVALMGISHGAYLGNKLSDDPNKAVKDQPYATQFVVKSPSLTGAQPLKLHSAPIIVGLVRNGALQDLSKQDLTIQMGDIILAFGTQKEFDELKKQAGP